MKEVVLKNKQKFIDALAEYGMSDHAKKVLHDVEYVVLIGPAGSGRNTVINGLVATGRYHFIVSDTTRPPKFRDGKMEQDGVNYFFRTEEDMLADLEAGEFLEAELIHNQQVSGTSIRELEASMKEDKIAVNETEFGGAKNVLAAKPDSKVFAIITPSYDEWLHRFTSREEIHRQEFINRTETLIKVVDTALGDDRIRVVVNDNHERATKELDALIQGAEQTPEQVEKVTTILHELKERAQEELKKA